jgi:hypothetical protein
MLFVFLCDYPPFKLLNHLADFHKRCTNIYHRRTAHSLTFQCPTVSNNNIAVEPNFRLSQGVGTRRFDFENTQVC